MPTFAQKQNQPPEQVSSSLARSNTAPSMPNVYSHPILHLQRTFGNQAVLRMLQANVEEPRVSLGRAPENSHDQEADRIAERVTLTAEPLAGTSQAAGPSTLSSASGHNREAEDHFPATVKETLTAPGQPLPPATRKFMETRFGFDFSHVCLHTDAKAAESAEAVKARAYAIGQHIVFGEGQLSPETNAGRHLLAHELVHVVQQQAGGSQRIQRQPHDPARFNRVPPGPGAYTEAEYKDWERRHPNSVLERAWETKPTHREYTPEWFWARGYFYAGAMYGGYQGARFEIWLSEEGSGHEYRLWREPKRGGVKAPSSVVTPKAPVIGHDYIDPNADREPFGPIIAVREDVDAAFGEGDVVLYEDGTVELFLKGTTQSYVFRPVSGGFYDVYGPDGKRLDKKWTLPEEDIPDPVTDAVE